MMHDRSWLLILGFLFCVGGVSALAFQYFDGHETVALGDGEFRGPEIAGNSEASSTDTFDVSLPKPQYPPEEVVRFQIEAMRATRSGAEPDNRSLITCYSFASPSNRAMTGPFERFAGIVLTPPYDRIATSKVYQIGDPVLGTDDVGREVAAVLVSAIADTDEVTAFRFILVKQQDTPYQDCWMTEAVMFAFSNSPEASVDPSTGQEMTRLE